MGKPPIRLNEKRFAEWEDQRNKEADMVINPITNKPIKVGGPTYLELEEAYQKMIQRQVQKQTIERPLAPIKEEGFDQLSKALNIVAQRSKPNVAAKIATIIPDNPYLYGVEKPKVEHIRERAQTLRSQKPAVFLDEASTKELIMEVAEMTQKDEIEISESETTRLKMGIRNIEMKPIPSEVVLKIQQYLDKELQNIRKMTRSQTAKTLLKKDTLSTRKPETYDTVLNKLEKWSKTSYDNQVIYKLVVSNLKRYSESPLSSEEKLVDAVYDAYDIPKDIASIYAFYVKYLLYIKLYDIISTIKFYTEPRFRDRIRSGEKIKIPIVLTVDTLTGMKGGKKTKKNVSKK